MQKQAIFLMGPTAVGKTALAIQLAQVLPVDLISVDSAMVYRGLDIGTGKPTADELAIAPHQLIDICDPSQPYSAAQFSVDAKIAMQRSWAQQRIPLLVGGTMLYFKALQFGLSELPAADPVLRAEISKQAEQFGWPTMHAKLAQLDPKAAARIKPTDPQRIQRALEINLLTNQPLDKCFEQQQTPIIDYKLHTFALLPVNRQELHVKIEQRFMQMLQQGFINEVEKLYARGDLHSDLPAIRAVGYRQAWEYLTGNVQYELMVQKAIAATRQLAKRQYTWLRSWPEVTVFENNNKMVLDTIVNSVLHSPNN